MEKNLTELAKQINLSGSSLSPQDRYLSGQMYLRADDCDCHGGDCSDCYCMDCNEGSD